MTYTYKGSDNSQFHLTDDSKLKYKSSTERDDSYKIVWAMNDDVTLGIDGNRFFLQKKNILLATS